MTTTTAHLASIKCPIGPKRKLQLKSILSMNFCKYTVRSGIRTHASSGDCDLNAAPWTARPSWLSAKILTSFLDCREGNSSAYRMRKDSRMWMLSFGKGHANLLCYDPTLVYVLAYIFWCCLVIFVRTVYTTTNNVLWCYRFWSEDCTYLFRCWLSFFYVFIFELYKQGFFSYSSISSSEFTKSHTFSLLHSSLLLLEAAILKIMWSSRHMITRKLLTGQQF